MHGRFAAALEEYRSIENQIEEIKESQVFVKMCLVQVKK